MRVNHAAVVVSAVVYFVLQGIWFTVMGDAWVAGTRLSAEEVAAAKAHPTPGPYVVAFLCNLIFAYVLAKLIGAARETTAMGGARVGLVVGFGIAFTSMVTEFVFEFKPLSFMLISAGVAVIGGVLMGAILGAWQGRPKEAKA